MIFFYTTYQKLDLSVEYSRALCCDVTLHWCLHLFSHSSDFPCLVLLLYSISSRNVLDIISFNNCYQKQGTQCWKILCKDIVSHILQVHLTCPLFPCSLGPSWPSSWKSSPSSVPRWEAWPPVCPQRKCWQRQLGKKEVQATWPACPSPLWAFWPLPSWPLLWPRWAKTTDNAATPSSAITFSRYLSANKVVWGHGYASTVHCSGLDLILFGLL